jgi:ribosomal protein S18 acetylase RimI-like enzyme
VTPEQLASAHDANFVSAIGLLADYCPGGWRGSFGRLPVAITGAPGAFFNAIWVLEPPDLGDLRSAVDHLQSRGLPFIVHVRGDLDRADRMSIDRIELADEGLLPCFAYEPGPIPERPVELEIRRVTEEDWEPFIATTCAGFGLPRSFVDELYSATMLAAPELRLYLGLVDGRAVASSAAVRTDATVGIYNVATVPDARGRGFGTALTWETMRDADPGWTVAVLQASEMGRPIYERMGFRLVREFVELAGRSTPG